MKLTDIVSARHTRRLLRVSYPLLSGVLRSHKGFVASLLLTGVALGSVPVLKSLMEAAVINEIDRITPSLATTRGTESVAADSPPLLTQPVNDFAGRIPSDQQRVIEEIFSDVYRSQNVAVVLATIETLPSGQTIDAFAKRMFANSGQGIGSADVDNGLLVLVVFGSEQVWIEPGAALARVTPESAQQAAQRIVAGLAIADLPGALSSALATLDLSGVESASPGVDRTDAGRPVTYSDLRARISRLMSLKVNVGSDEPEADLTDRLAYFALSGHSIFVIFFLYFASIWVNAALEYAATRSRATVAAELYAGIRAVGTTKALVSAPTTTRSAANPAAYVVTAVNGGAEAVADTFAYGIDAVRLIIALATALMFVFGKGWIFGVLCAAVAIWELWLSKRQAVSLRGSREEIDATRNNLAARTDDILSKRELILAYEQQLPYAGRLDKLARDYANVDRLTTSAEARFAAMKQLVADTGRAVLIVGLLVAAVYAIAGQRENLGGSYFLISMYVRLLAPFRSLVAIIDRVRRTEAKANTFLALLDEPEPVHAANANAEMAHPSRIDFDDVVYTYDTTGPVLHHCTFHAPAGKVTMLLGPSGSGKSTIVRLVLGFLTPHSGVVSVGGVDTRRIDPYRLRLSMSYVAQGDYIIEDTIRDNLVWSKPTPSDVQMLEALKIVGLLRNGEDSEILDRRARDLSVGQMQRLSLARLLLDDAPTFILDEPLAGVDVFTTRDLISPISTVFRRRERTVLLATHKLALTGLADHIVVLGHDGSVREQGSPAELLAARGAYYDILTAAATDFPAELFSRQTDSVTTA